MVIYHLSGLTKTTHFSSHWNFLLLLWNLEWEFLKSDIFQYQSILPQIMLLNLLLTIPILQLLLIMIIMHCLLMTWFWTWHPTFYMPGDMIFLWWLSRNHLVYWCAILIAHQIVMAKHGGSCVHFSGISTCGRTSRETVSHSQRQPLPTPHKIALPVYVTVTNKRLQPLTTTLYNSLVLSFSLLTTKRRLIKHWSFLRVLRSS